jgi:hypothetical protein
MAFVDDLRESVKLTRDRRGPRYGHAGEANLEEQLALEERDELNAEIIVKLAELTGMLKPVPPYNKPKLAGTPFHYPVYGPVGINIGPDDGEPDIVYAQLTGALDEERRRVVARVAIRTLKEGIVDPSGLHLVKDNSMPALEELGSEFSYQFPPDRTQGRLENLHAFNELLSLMISAAEGGTEGK